MDTWGDVSDGGWALLFPSVRCFLKTALEIKKPAARSPRAQPRIMYQGGVLLDAAGFLAR
jgi:hypothetical protein